MDLSFLKFVSLFFAAENLSQKAQSEKLKQRVTEHREKRRIESKLSHMKSLGESDEDDSAQAWVSRSRKMQEERVQAEKRVRIKTVSYVRDTRTRLFSLVPFLLT